MFIASEDKAERREPASPDSRRGQLVLEFPHATSQAVDDFIVGDGNRLAYERVLSYPNWPEPMTLLFGPEKSGKSHLARVFAERAGAHFAAPDELEQLARRGGDMPLVVEDVDRGGIREDALFHLLNQSMRDRRPLLLTAKLPITDWPYATDDVRSRARLAVALDLELTDDIQLSQMFMKLFGDRQVFVDGRTISYLVTRMERSAAEAVALCELMDRLALQRNSAITRRIAAEALDIRHHQRHVDMRRRQGDDEDE